MKRLLFHLWYDNEAREAVQILQYCLFKLSASSSLCVRRYPFRPGRTDRFYAGRPIPGSFECRPFFFNVILRFPWLYSVITKQSVPNTCIS